LGAGSPEGVGGLLGVAALDALATFPAVADRYPGTGLHHLWLAQVDLPLLGVSFVL